MRFLMRKESFVLLPLNMFREWCVPESRIIFLWFLIWIKIFMDLENHNELQLEDFSEGHKQVSCQLQATLLLEMEVEASGEGFLFSTSLTISFVLLQHDHYWKGFKEVNHSTSPFRPQMWTRVTENKTHVHIFASFKLQFL